MFIYTNNFYNFKEKVDLIKNIILIGEGSHANKRIIPSLKKKKINLKGIYTRKKSILNEFKSEFLKKKYFFYICTPPNSHFKIVNFLLNHKQNVIVEKPAIIKSSHLKSIKKKISKSNKNIFIENLMYRYSKIFSKFNNYWLKNEKKIFKLELNFLIPNFFEIGFRSKTKDKFIILHDIGIYPLSLLNILDIEMTKIEILNIKFFKQKIKKLKLKINSKNLVIFVNIGEHKNYVNNLIISESDGSKITYDKIFSGIEVSKTINKVNKVIKINKKFVIKDHNCFEKFFSFKFNYLKSLKNSNLNLIEKNIKLFDKIKLKIKSN